MNKISRKMAKFADLPYGYLQLFAEGTPALEDSPEFKEDLKEFSAFEKKMAKFTEERKSKEAEKETSKQTKEPAEKIIEKELVKETVKAVHEEVATPEQKPKQDAETNKAFQEQRKAREEAETKAKVLEEKAARADALIKAQFGKQGITTVEQYEQWIKDGQDEADTERYKTAGLTEVEIEKIRKFDEIQAKAESTQQEQSQQAYLSQWEALYKAYPDLKTDAEAFREGKDPSFYNDEMKAELARGSSPLAAYRNAHFETILANATKGTKETAKQEALDQMNSKNHIKANAQLGGDVDHVEISNEQMAIYRRLTGKTDAEIRKFHKKQLAGG